MCLLFSLLRHAQLLIDDRKRVNLSQSDLLLRYDREALVRDNVVVLATILIIILILNQILHVLTSQLRY